MTLKLLEDTKLANCAPRNNNPKERSSHFAAEATNHDAELGGTKNASM
jgi:hypothetical protein